AQHVAGITPLTTNAQKITADVSGNGAVSSNDAAKIAQYVAGVTPLPPPNLTGTWRFFVPNPTFPIGTSPTTRTYTAPIGMQTAQDYVGILGGDVTGNWSPSGARPASGPERSASIALPRLMTPADNEVIIPVAVQGAASKGIISYE